MQDLNILVTSLVPDKLNTNQAIRTYLADGVMQAYLTSSVFTCPLETALTKIAELRPNLIIAIGGLVPDTVDLRGLRRAADKVGARIAFWLHDDPYEFDYAFKANSVADIIFTNDRASLSQYNHQSVHHLPMGACPKTHFRPLQLCINKDIAVSFCGVGYPNRVSFLRQAAHTLERGRVEIYGTDWPTDLQFCRNKRLKSSEMIELASRSLITLNIGRQFNIANRRYNIPASTPGPRTFEVALAGSAQIYLASGHEIYDYFLDRCEMIIAHNVKDVQRAITQSIDEPTWAMDIAKRAQERALKDHSYMSRASTMIELALGLLS